MPENALKQPLTPEARFWNSPDTIGVIFPEDLDSGKVDKISNDSSFTKDWISTARKIRTVLGANKDILKNNPKLETQLVRLLIVHMAKLIVKDEVLPIFGELDTIQNDVTAVFKKFGIAFVWNEVKESTLYESDYIFMLSLALDSTFIFSNAANPMQDLTDYQNYLNGSFMVWILAQGAFFGFAKFIGFNLAMQKQGISLEKIAQINTNQLGLSGIAVQKDDKNMIIGQKEFISSKFIDYIKNNPNPDIPYVFLLDETISSGKTITDILTELLKQLGSNELISKVVIIEGVNTRWEYSKDLKGRKHLWKRVGNIIATPISIDFLVV